MISVSEAKQIIKEHTGSGKKISFTLTEAAGFTLAEAVYATTDIPAYAQSSMDGYAFAYADKNKILTVQGEMAAGAGQQFTLKPGHAARIFTGAPLPDGADTVIMQEKVEVKEGKILLTDANLTLGLNVRPKGAEVTKDICAMDAGTYLSAAAVGFLAGIGCTHATVYAPPSVTIILTGNELQEPGKPLDFGQVYEANSVLLIAALQKAGIKNCIVLKAEDNLIKLTEVLQQAIDTSDTVLLTGGVSVGDYDFVTAAATACGITQKFHKIKQKPGKPLYFGTIDDKLVFGLPGNPSSGLTCFYEYVLPAIEQLMHKDPCVTATTAKATHSYNKPAGLTHFLKAFYQDGRVTPLHAQESFRLHSFAQANCFIVLPEEAAGCAPDDEVEVHLLPL